MLRVPGKVGLLVWTFDQTTHLPGVIPAAADQASGQPASPPMVTVLLLDS